MRAALADAALDPSYIGYIKKAQGIKADAWDYNEANGVLSLLIADFRMSATVPTITESEVDSIILIYLTFTPQALYDINNGIQHSLVFRN